MSEYEVEISTIKENDPLGFSSAEIARFRRIEAAARSLLTAVEADCDSTREQVAACIALRKAIGGE